MSITFDILQRIDRSSSDVFDTNDVKGREPKTTLTSTLTRLVGKNILARVDRGRYRRLVSSAVQAYPARLERKQAAYANGQPAKVNVTMGILQRIDSAAVQFRGLSVRGDAHRSAHGSVIKRLVKKKILAALGDGLYRRLVPSVVHAYVGGLRNESSTTKGGPPPPLALANQTQTATYRILQHLQTMPDQFLYREAKTGVGDAAGSLTFVLGKMIDRGLVERMGKGTRGHYRKLVPDVLKAYYDTRGRQLDKPNAAKPVRSKLTAKDSGAYSMPIYTMPYDENGMMLLRIGRRIILWDRKGNIGQEVALVKRGGGE